MRELKRIRKCLSGVFLIMLFIFLPSIAIADWTVEDVDAPKYFINFYPGAIALDSLDRPHIAYGGDYLYHAYFDGSMWQYETVDTSYGVGDYTSIAIDSNDKVYISYNGYGSLKYATNASGAWVISTIDTQAYGETSLAIDSNDKVHISYVGVWADNNLKYATNESGIWVISTITTSGGIGEHNSIAIDSNNKVHISYYDGSTSNLKYVTNASGDWIISTIDSSAGHTSIALDSNNKVHISYVGGWPDYNLRYATNTSGTWDISTIDSIHGSYNSIAIDSNNKVHISYWSANPNNDLKYATDASGIWVLSTIDSSGYVGIYTSLAIDSNDKLHISYYDDTNSGLKYATNTSGDWIMSTIDGSGDVGLSTSIAIDSNDKVHISYYDYDNGNLKYATNASGVWVTSTIDSSTLADTSIAVDSNNNVHICYFEDSHDTLKYATNKSGAWVMSTIDTQVYDYCSIAVDSINKVHISYWAEPGGLKYATNASGAWVISTIDSTEGVGEHNSIAIDSNDKIHIIYLDSYPYDNLKYATNASGIWFISTIDSSGVAGSTTSIAIDSNNHIHIGYFRKNPNGGLRYATNASGAWVMSTIDSFAGHYASIAVDSNNKVHISYLDPNGTESLSKLKYTTNAFGEWVISTIDGPGGKYSSIAIDSHDISHISYSYGYDLQGDLKHAYGYTTQTGAPDISVTPPSHDFGNVLIGSGGSIKDFTITNVGDAVLTIGEIFLIGSSEFVLWGSEQCSNMMISPSHNCSFFVWFTPTTVGTKGANVGILSNDPNTPMFNIPLSGAGYSDTIILLSPNGFEVIPSGSTYTIQWGAPSEVVKFDIGYSLDDGAPGTWKLIATNLTISSYNWTIPSFDGNKNACRVGVRGYNASGGVVGIDTSDNPFTIEVVKLTVPNGGELLTSGETYQITWQINSTVRPVQSVQIYGSPNEGQSGTWRLLTTVSGNPGYYDWTVPSVGSIKDKCRLGVRLLDSMSTPIGQDAGDGNFTIQPAP